MVGVAKNDGDLAVHRPTKAKVSNGGSSVSTDGKSPESADLRSPLGRSHRARTHESVRPPARSQILSAGVFGGELALKLGQTLGESWAGHTPTLHIGVC